MEPAGLCGRCTGVAVPLRVVGGAPRDSAGSGATEEGLTSRGGRHLRLPLRFGLRPQGPCRVGTLLRGTREVSFPACGEGSASLLWSHGWGIGHQETLKKDSPSLSRVTSGNPGFPRLVPVTSGTVTFTAVARVQSLVRERRSHKSRGSAPPRKKIVRG